MQTGTATTGTLTANGQSVSANISPASHVALQVLGTWTGTLQLEGTIDGTNWFGLASVATHTASTTTVIQTTANGMWYAFTAPYNAVRVRASAAMTGTANVLIQPAMYGGL